VLSPGFLDSLDAEVGNEDMFGEEADNGDY